MPKILDQGRFSAQRGRNGHLKVWGYAECLADSRWWFLIVDGAKTFDYFLS